MGGAGFGRTMGNKAFYWDGLILSTVVMQDLLATIFSSDNGIHEAILFQFLNCCSLFYEKKLSFLGTINFLFERLRSNSLSEGAARSYKKREFWHQIKALLWLCLEVSFFSCVKKKTSFRILTGSTIYTRVKKIFRSSNWLELIRV